MAVLIGPVSALAAIGALTLPGDVLFGWMLLGAGAGILVAFGASRLRRGRAPASGPDLPVGAATALAFFTACLVLAGLLATVGGALTATVLFLLAAGGLGAAYRHHRVAPPTAPESHDGPVPRPVPPVPVADLATEDLCVAWRRSYFLLLLAVDDPARRRVVQRRQDFLDEIERRDRSGFLRWLDSGAQAGSDPSPYLTTRS
ncbi:hypothetical protein [Amycolatopsis kentuckyensis]|uniref:hypothetical protein n=1 Tax=Amycolatopsis kentuckyensis TaxID=218823 RepID=UPI001FC9DE0A|nr:hypothetical protein [Amycolatopsis kentuckyensis]